MRNQHLCVEIFELLISDDKDRDRRIAATLVEKLDTKTLADLREVGNELAVMAEKMYFEKRRQERGKN